MSAKNPRINVVLDKYLYDVVKQLAKKDGVSLSLKTRDLIREALELYEDLALSQWAEERDRTFDEGRSLSHAQVWGK
jgi:hypothetical protein